MANQSWFEKIKDRKIGRLLAVYMGSAWVFIEAFNFFIDKYNWNAEALNIIILLIVFGLPATIIFAWFDGRFTKMAILLQVLNCFLFISLFSYTQIKPNSINATQLRLLKFKDNQKKLAEAIRSIAILPFDNYTGDDSQEYICLGMHDALISELGQIGSLIVKSKTSSLAYSNSEKTIKEIASELNVDAIIEASVLNIGDRIRIQLKLINAFPEEQQLWTQTFESEFSNILDLYNQVITNISNEIQITLSPEQETQLTKARQVNPESYKAYLRGMYHIHQLTPEGINKGLEYLQDAIRIDPAEPLAYSGLALGYLEIAHGFFATNNIYNKAEAAVSRAIELDSTMAETYLAQAELYMYSLWEFDKAEDYFLRALDINPNLAQTHYHYAWALYLFGRMEEAIIHHEIAKNIDPLNPLYTALLGALYSYDGQYENAIQEAQESLELLKDYPYGLWVLGETYLAMGLENDAIEASKKLAEVAPWFSWPLGYAYALNGHTEEAELILRELEKSELNSWSAMGISVIYGALGNMDKAFKWLEYEPPHLWIPWVAVMPMWRTFYNDARYEEFVKKLNLPK